MSSITQDKNDEAHAIHRLDTLLREIAVIVKGAEPPLTKWSYHDLPDLVRALAAKPAASVVDDAMVERALGRYAFLEDGAEWPGDYSDEELAPERKAMRAFLNHVLNPPALTKGDTK